MYTIHKENTYLHKNIIFTICHMQYSSGEASVKVLRNPLLIRTLLMILTKSYHEHIKEKHTLYDRLV